MSDSKDSTIPTDKEATTKDTTSKKPLNIRGFFNAFLRFAIYLIIVVLLSIGFKIILTHYDPNNKNPNLFPGMEIEGFPYSNFNTTSTTEQKGGATLNTFFDKFFPMNKWSFPYKNKYSELSEPGIFGNIILWITESIAFSNQLLRKIMGIIIESISSYKDNTYVFWLFGILILISSPFIPLLGLAVGFIGPIMAFERIWVGWKFFLLMCLPFLVPALLYGFSILTTTTIIAHIQSLYTLFMAFIFFILFPYSLPNSKTIVKETLTQHRYGILRGLLLGVVINAFRYLNNGFGLGALGLFILTMFGLI